MRRLSQNDIRWKKTCIGTSKSTIGGNGCLITSLCMVLSKWYPHKAGWINPDQAAKEWVFVKQGNDPEAHYLAYQPSQEAFRKAGMEFVWRNYTYDPSHEDKIRKLLKEGKGICLCVKTKSGGQHWLAVDDMSAFDYTAYDPWDGTVVRNVIGKYPRILGYLTMQQFKK